MRERGREGERREGGREGGRERERGTCTLTGVISIQYPVPWPTRHLQCVVSPPIIITNCTQKL